MRDRGVSVGEVLNPPSPVPVPEADGNLLLLSRPKYKPQGGSDPSPITHVSWVPGAGAHHSV